MSFRKAANGSETTTSTYACSEFATAGCFAQHMQMVEVLKLLFGLIYGESVSIGSWLRLFADEDDANAYRRCFM